MQNALIYSAGFEGHRQVYVYILAHVLTTNGYTVFIAGNLHGNKLDSSYIDEIRKDKRIKFIDTSVYDENGLNITLKEFVQIQLIHEIDLTIFAEADHHLSLFTTQIYQRNNRLVGKTVGIFLRPFFFYENLNFIDKLKYLKRLKDNWRYNTRLFHNVTLRRFKLLDVSCYIDEYFVSKHKHTVWLPDVFQQYAEELIKDEKPTDQVWIGILDKFVIKNSKRFIFLYFGTAQRRRGYDILLRLAVENDACFVHCGLKNENESFENKIDDLRSELINKDRLLETNQYISDPVCIEHFFKSVSHLILPYRNFLGSSGVMLQALEYGIPVLVPNSGIIGYRVRKHNLGSTYETSFAALNAEFKKFVKMPKEHYSESIEKYMQSQSIHQLKTVLNSICETAS